MRITGTEPRELLLPAVPGNAREPGSDAFIGRVASEASGEAAGQQAVTGPFATVPDPVVFQILSYLAADDLLACAQTCRFFALASHEDALWQRLFAARWGSGAGGADVAASSFASYMDRDAADLSEAAHNGAGPQHDIYLQMAVAKRGLTPQQRRARLDNGAPSEQLYPAGRLNALDAWRRRHGFTDPTALATHSCVPLHHMHQPARRPAQRASADGGVLTSERECASGASTSTARPVIGDASRCTFVQVKHAQDTTTQGKLNPGLALTLAASVLVLF